MPLTAPERLALFQALRAAFPTFADFHHLLHLGLGEPPASIYGGTNLDEGLRTLIQWAEARAQVTDLVLAAQTQRPDSAALRQWTSSGSGGMARARASLLPPRPPQPWAERPELAALRTQLLSGVVPLLIATEGRGGLGKTALIQKLAWDPALQAAYPDGVFWVALGPDPDLSGALVRLAAALGEDITGEPDLAGRAAIVRALLAPRRCLLLFDDVWDPTLATMCRDLNQIALLTTRMHAVAHAFAPPRQAVALTDLTPETALTHLQELAPTAAAAPELPQVVAWADGLPLALRLLAPLIEDEARMGWGLAEFLTQLTDPRWRGNRLDQLIGTSLDRLPSDDQTAFVQLAVFGARPADWDVEAATAVWSVPAAAARDRLRRLVGRHLVDPGPGPGRFSLHQSLADVAAVRLDDASVERRHAAHYLARVERDPADWREIAVEMPQIRRAWEAVTNDPVTMLAFVQALRLFQQRQGLWSEQIQWTERGLQAVRTLGRQADEGTLLNAIGRGYYHMGERRRGLAYYEQALAMHHALGDQRGQAQTFSDIAWAYRGMGDLSGALAYYAQALPLWRALDDQAGQAQVLNDLGRTYHALGDLHQAQIYYEQALPLWDQVGDSVGRAWTLNNIGRIYRTTGHFAEALVYYQQALPSLESAGDRAGQGAVLNSLGRVYYALGDSATALAYFAQVLAIRVAIGDAPGQAQTLNDIGHIYQEAGDLAQAQEMYVQALEHIRLGEDPGGQARTLTNLAEVAVAQGATEQALAYLEQARPLQSGIGDQSGQAHHWTNLGRLYASLVELAQARMCFAEALPLWITLGDQTLEAEVRWRLAQVEYALHNWPAAIQHLEQVLILEEGVTEQIRIQAGTLLAQIQQAQSSLSEPA